MQAQIHSYNFPLSQGGQNSFISTLKNKQILVATALQEHDESKSYLEENPKKSSSQSREVKGRVMALESAQNESTQTSMSCMVVANEGKYQVHHINLDRYQSQQDAWSQVLHEQASKITGLNFKKDGNGVFLTEGKAISMLDLEKGKAQEWLKTEENITHVAVDQLHEFTAYCANQKDIVICDKKSNNQKYRIVGRQNDHIIGIDFNPTKQYCLMSCHYETLKIWDIRKGNLPVKCFDDHQNIIVQAKYHPCHDELVACAYDDGTVALQRLSSVCSSPQKGVEDAVVKLYDQHEDSVFKLAWCAFSSWVFATVTYDASNLVINMVPQVQRYRILL